jgi:hypothetical protein
MWVKEKDTLETKENNSYKWPGIPSGNHVATIGKPSIGKVRLDEASEDFDQFWKAYPKKKAKQTALKAFNKNKSYMPPIEAILNHINMMSMTKDWQKEKGQYIPYPATWLNAHGWDDEVNLSDYEKGKAIQKHLGISATEYDKRLREGTLWKS